jgi:hypothetical protein
MRTINHYSVEISDKTGIIGERNEFKIEQHQVIAENDDYLVIDDRRFTTLKKGESDYETCLDKENINLASGDSCWGNRIWYSLYTEKEVKAAYIRKAIDRAVKKKFGFYIGDLNSTS